MKLWFCYGRVRVSGGVLHLALGCADDRSLSCRSSPQSPGADGVPASDATVLPQPPEGEDKENRPEEEDDGGGWITPGNIGQVKMDSADWTAAADVTVGCVTTDFAMQVRRRSSSAARLPVPMAWSGVFQNVLVQIGLHVLSLNGMVIKQARNYILRCHACFK